MTDYLEAILEPGEDALERALRQAEDVLARAAQGGEGTDLEAPAPKTGARRESGPAAAAETKGEAEETNLTLLSAKGAPRADTDSDGAAGPEEAAGAAGATEPGNAAGPSYLRSGRDDLLLLGPEAARPKESENGARQEQWPGSALDWAESSASRLAGALEQADRSAGQASALAAREQTRPARGLGTAEDGSWTPARRAGRTQAAGGDSDTAQWVDRIFRRDSRRYDGGFFLY